VKSAGDGRATPGTGILARLGLHSREIRAWAMYDWANSAFMTTIILIFPIYFVTVAAADLPSAKADEIYAWATALAMVVVALLAPVLGAMADRAGIKKKMLAGFMLFGVTTTASLYFVDRGDWLLGAALFVLASIGINASFVFYESLLPHIASEEDIDRVSSAGYALGYLGGGAILAINLLWITYPQRFGFADAGAATRVSFLSAAVWWLAFSIPLFKRVPEPPHRVDTAPVPEGNALLVAVTRLRRSVRDLRGYPQAFLLLIAFVLYNDGIQTVIKMATLYGTSLGISKSALIGAVLMTQFVGVPFSFLFGSLARRLGTKRSIFLALAVYVGITIFAYRMRTAAEFYVLAVAVAMVQGGTQALSRSLFATMIPRYKSAEFFGFYGVFDKFGGVLGPMLFASVIRTTGSSRPAILATSIFFAIGGAVLWFVDVDEGRRVAREAEDREALVTPVP
jgi:UMF1 family MFS transporter